MVQVPLIVTRLCCQALRDRRLDLRLSQEDLSKKSGLARSYICDVERGARNPSLRNVTLLSYAMNFSPAKLFREIEIRMMSNLTPDVFRQDEIHNESHREIIHYVNECCSDGFMVADPTGITYFNPAAAAISGIGEYGIPPESWAEVYGCYSADGKTEYRSEDLPLYRAMYGESMNNVPIFLRNKEIPNGVQVSVTSRPIYDTSGNPCGGVISMTKQHYNGTTLS